MSKYVKMAFDFLFYFSQIIHTLYKVCAVRAEAQAEGVQCRMRKLFVLHPSACTAGVPQPVLHMLYTG